MSDATDRLLIIRSRLIDKRHFSEYNLTSVRHILIDWLPRAIYADLTDDTASVDVSIRKEFGGGKLVFEASFISGDGSVIAKKSYIEEKLQGVVCYQYDSKKSRYLGTQGEFDCREVAYSPDEMIKTIPMFRQ
jgi:hypothetical protein